MTNEIIKNETNVEIEKYKIDKQVELRQQKLDEASNIVVGNLSLSAISLMAEKFASSGDMIPKEFQGNPQKCFAAIYKGASLGLDAFTALQRISIINGRATIWGDTALSLVRKSGLMIKFKEELIKGSNGKLEAHCTVQRKGEEEHISSFSQDDAIMAGLWGGNVWKKYPQRMLKYRARAYALRDIFADILDGLYLKEEMEGSEMLDITPKSKTSNYEPESEIETIDSEQGLELEGLAKTSNQDLLKICKIHGINSIIELPIAKFEALKTKLGGNNANS